ncbi:phospholipid carrier-dependent glycosyltransferase [Candidatus Shapirobacteria bacterium]|nr:phospholipid carrier-dependent glycosyltransferase [Candidatus Shapirobacteria bacterium]
MKIFSKFKLYIVHCTLLIVILAGAFLRFYGLNWDQGHHLHPDERMITMVATGLHLPKTEQEWQNVLTPASPLNPKFFAYGSFPIYFLKFSGWLFSHFDSRWAEYDWINLLGRGISGIADLGVIFLIFLLGKKVWSEKVGLLAALLYTLSVLPIQLSRFYAVDSLLNLFIIATLYRLIVFYEKPRFKNALLVGLFLGLALATKISAAVLIVAVGAALLADLILILLGKLRRRHLELPKMHPSLIFPILKFGLIITLISLLTFVALEPYALIDFSTFWRQTQEQQAMTKNAYVFPYTLQFVGTIPYLYHLKNMIFWGMGIPLGILAMAAILGLLVHLIKEVPKPGNENQEAKMLILASFFLVYFLVVGRFAIKFMRYFLPLYPLFCLFASWFLYRCINTLKQKLSPKIFAGLYLCIFASLLIWPLSFVSIYAKPHSRVLASRWINQNIPPGSKLAVEHWDDSLPLFGGHNYQFLEMPMYEPDTSESKWQKVNNNLGGADYLILSSNRLYVPLQKLADCQKYKVCYPKTAEYYQNLFNEKLGFTKVAEFSSYPEFYILHFKFYINDDPADENFTVFDHPKVIIFKKSQER